MAVSTAATLTIGKGSARHRLPSNSLRTGEGCRPERGKEKVPTPGPAFSAGAKARAGRKDQGCRAAKVCPAYGSMTARNGVDDQMESSVRWVASSLRFARGTAPCRGALGRPGRLPCVKKARLHSYQWRRGQVSPDLAKVRAHQHYWCRTGKGTVPEPGQVMCVR